MEPRRAVDAHKGGADAQNGKWSRGGSVDQWLQNRITLMRSRIRIRMKEKRWIRSGSATLAVTTIKPRILRYRGEAENGTASNEI
jgi:hypothetical protein